MLGILNFALDLLAIFGLPLLQFIHGAWTDAPGRGLAFEGSARLTSLRFPVDKTPEVGYMGWEQLTLATLTTVRKDRKIKGFPQTHENKLGT